jgi:hypothetical protein
MVEVFAVSRFSAMELITILNHCHRFKGFVYHQARFTPDNKSIEMSVRPRVPLPSAHGAVNWRPATINSQKGALSLSPCEGFSSSCCTPCAASIVAAVAPLLSKKFLGPMASGR